MATITRFEDLEIWQLARVQAKAVFELLSRDVFSRDFKLKNQMNGSSGSVMDNIAEGFERSANGEFKYFLCVSKGSNGELKSQLYRSLDRNYITQEELDKFLGRNVVIGNKTNTLMEYLGETPIKGQRYRNRRTDSSGEKDQPPSNC